MGPPFSGVFLLLIGGMATVVSFGVAKIFLPMKAAAIAAVLFVGFGGLGTLIGLFSQAFWLPPTLETPRAVFSFLAFGAICGLVFGGVAVRIFVTRRRSGRMRT